MKTLRIAICGCGPAGLCAALLLHRLGHQVTIFERFEKPKPVGSGLLLQPTGLAVLAELQLLEPILQLGTPIDRLFGVAMPSQRVALDVSYRALGSGWRALGIHRAALFETLYSAACKHNIAVVSCTTIATTKTSTPEHLNVVSDDGLEFGPFDLVIDALGANSPLARGNAKKQVLEYGALWVNVPWPNDGLDATRLEQRYVGARQMLGVLPIGRQSLNSPPCAALFWSLKRTDFYAWRSRGIMRWREEVRALWPQAANLLTSIEDVDAVTFAQYDHFTARVPYRDGVVQIGDAAHATSPQLGQGANMALLDALALARAINSSEDIQLALQRYAYMRRWHIKLFQGASKIFTPFYQSDSAALPFVRDWITAPLSRMPIGDRIVAKLVSGMTVAPLRGERFAAHRLS